ncbi:MAG: hypothetical protein V3V16_10625 [Melioribacteraceae bacterium]
MKKSLQKCYKNYLGNGNPKAKYWFIGFEPGGVIDKDPRTKHHLENDTDECFVSFMNEPLTDNVEQGVYTALSKFLENLELTDCLNKNKTSFSFTKDSSAFFTNLYPLKFPSENHKDNDYNLEYYKQIFGINSLNRQEIYPAEWIKRRSKLFEEFLVEKEKTILIFKNTKNPLYELLLNVENFGEIKYSMEAKNRSKSMIDFYEIIIGDRSHQVIVMPNDIYADSTIKTVCEKIK